jgi:predicted nucleic acid-binding protein
MIILDTNVVSELMRPRPNQAVYNWVHQQDPLTLGLTVFTVAEIRHGIGRLPEGKKQTQLDQLFAHFLAVNFPHEVFPFDEAAATLYADIAAQQEKNGIIKGSIDLMIAAIALMQKARLATRNVKDFRHCGIDFVNPWETDS